MSLTEQGPSETIQETATVVPFPFIVGSGRSGTTLLRALLDSHPELAIPPESYFIVTLARQAGKYERETGLDIQALAGDVGAHPRFRRWDLEEEAMRERLREAAPRTYPDAIRAIFELYAERRGKPRYADKTPKYVKDMRRLVELFPEARFVHVIRDGRDVVLSFSELDWGPTSAIEGALRWRNWVEAGREAGKELGSERYTEIRYEELVADPERVLRGVCAFLALDYEGSMFDYVEHAEEIIAPNYYPEGHARIRLPPTTGLRDWRTQMKREDLVKFELVAGDVLAELGYERAVPAASAKRPRESDDEQVEGAPAIETGQDVELGDELPALIEETNFLRKRVHRLSYRRRRAIDQRERAERRGERKLATAKRRHENELRRHDRRAERKIANLERRRQTAVRRRKKVERTLRGLEETRWWQFRLRMRRLFAPLEAVRARRRLR